jgi:hypothetical protein
MQKASNSFENNPAANDAAHLALGVRVRSVLPAKTRTRAAVVTNPSVWPLFGNDKRC